MGSLIHGPLVTEELKVELNIQTWCSWSLSTNQMQADIQVQFERPQLPYLLYMNQTGRPRLHILRREAKTNESAFLHPSTVKPELRVDLLNTFQINILK